MRLVGKQREFEADPGCEISYDANWAAWDQKALTTKWRLISADAEERKDERSDHEHLRLLQGLAAHIPEEIRVATGFNAKWAKLMAAPGARGSHLARIAFPMTRFHDDMEDLAAMARNWHRDQMLSVVEQNERRVRALLEDGAWDEALASNTALIRPLEDGRHWHHLEGLLMQMMAIHLGLLQVDRAEECADYLLGHWSPVFGHCKRWDAKEVKRRAAVARSRGLYRGTRVRICNHSASLDGRIGMIKGRKGACDGNFSLYLNDDQYAASAGTKNIVLDTKHRCFAPMVVQLSVRDREDGSAGVIGTTLGGAECAQFVVTPADLLHPSRLAARTAHAMARPSSHIQRPLPDGSLAGGRSGGESRGRTPRAASVGSDKRA